MEIRYSKDHVWVRRESDTARIGLSEFAQNELGEIVFVEPPERGKRVEKGEPICSIDALKSTSDIYAPITGRIVEVNEKLGENNARIVNSDPLGDGWLCLMTIENEADLSGLLSEEEYRHYVQ